MINLRHLEHFDYESLDEGMINLRHLEHLWGIISYKFLIFLRMLVSMKWWVFSFSTMISRPNMVFSLTFFWSCVSSPYPPTQILALYVMLIIGWRFEGRYAIFDWSSCGHTYNYYWGKSLSSCSNKIYFIFLLIVVFFILFSNTL